MRTISPVFVSLFLCLNLSACTTTADFGDEYDTEEQQNEQDAAPPTPGHNFLASAWERMRATTKRIKQKSAKSEPAPPSCYELAKTPLDRRFCDAAAGQAKAMADIADRYHAGDCLPRDLTQAATWYEKAAQHGSTYAQLMLSILYEQGRGVPQDLPCSVYWYDRALKSRHLAMAQFCIAKRYIKGQGLPQNDALAVKWFELAAKQRFAPAEIEMGDAFHFGRGIEQNDSKAFDWYLLAAEQGHAYGQSMVGLMLLHGQGVEPNLPEALLWTQKAAHQGARQAQYQMAQFYLNGQGVRKSKAQAYAWWTLSLRDLQDQPPPELNALIADMDPNTRRHAVALSKEYQKKYGHKFLPKI